MWHAFWSLSDLPQVTHILFAQHCGNMVFWCKVHLSPDQFQTVPHVTRILLLLPVICRACNYHFSHVNTYMVLDTLASKNFYKASNKKSCSRNSVLVRRIRHWKLKSSSVIDFEHVRRTLKTRSTAIQMSSFSALVSQLAKEETIENPIPPISFPTTGVKFGGVVRSVWKLCDVSGNANGVETPFGGSKNQCWFFRPCMCLAKSNIETYIASHGQREKRKCANIRIRFEQKQYRRNFAVLSATDRGATKHPTIYDCKLEYQFIG